MINVNIQCSCGQKFGFEVEPINGRMPWDVKCPGCGADQTNAANEIIAREIGSQPPPLRLPGRSEPPFPEPPFPTHDPELIGRGGTMAGNPARLRVDWARSLATRPAPLVLGIIMIVFGAVVCFALQPGWIGLVFIAVAGLLWRNHYREVRQKFYAGDVCAGIILSDTLVAVTTNLSVGGVSRPAIKVMRYPLSHMAGGPPARGTRVATVALYRGPATDGAWRDFSPEVIACWVSNENDLQRVTQSIMEWEWRSLDTLLARIPKVEPDLYKMWGSTAGKVKPAMHPVVEIFLTLVAAAGIFAGPTFAIVHQWKLKHPSQTASVAPAQPPPEETPAPTPEPAQPAPATSAPRPAARTAPPKPPPPPPRPVVPAAIDLGGQFITFTNLQGKSFENVRLMKADPRSGLIYSFDAGVGSVPFNTLPLEFLQQIGVPTNWPGVMQGRVVAPAPANAKVATPDPTRFAVGDKVEVQWAGKWEPARIVGFDRFNIIVHFSDPASPIRNDLHVPTNWVRHAP